MSPGTITATSGLAKSIPHGSVPTVRVFKGQRDEFAGHHEHENHPEACSQQKPLVVHVVKRQPFSDSSWKTQRNAPTAYSTAIKQKVIKNNR